MEVDPEEVLYHLNALGYENVEPHLFQKFIKGIITLFTFMFFIIKQNNYCIFVYVLGVIQ